MSEGMTAIEKAKGALRSAQGYLDWDGSGEPAVDVAVEDLAAAVRELIAHAEEQDRRIAMLESEREAAKRGRDSWCGSFLDRGEK